MEFSWPHQELLRRVGRGRYLSVAVAPASPQVRFGEGFFGPEIDRSVAPSGEQFRWMGGRGVLWLPAGWGCRRVSFDLVVPLDRLVAPPQIVLALDGAEVDRIHLTSSRAHVDVDLPAEDSPGRERRLEIQTSQTFVPAQRDGGSDHRALGLEIRAVRLECRNSAASGP